MQKIKNPIKSQSQLVRVHEEKKTAKRTIRYKKIKLK